MTLPVDVSPAYEASHQLLLVPLSATEAAGKASKFCVRDGDTDLLVVDAAARTVTSSALMSGPGALGCIEQSFTVAEMTDGGSTSGTIDLTGTVPVGAVILRCQVDVTGAFTGDVSATIQVGDGTDVDRFNTGTPSVFTTGHKDMGAPSGTAYVATAIVPRVTITSGSNFTLVVDGGSGAAATVRISYLLPAS